MKALLLLALPSIIVAMPMAASAQRDAQSDCAAVRQTRVFAQSQGMDSADLERLERRACRRGQHGRHGQRAERGQHGQRAEREERTDAGCQTLRMMEEIATIAGDGSTVSQVAGARQVVCSADYGDGTLNWGSGRQLRSGGGTYYWPDGRQARSIAGTWYYPDGRQAQSTSGTWYYPDGRQAKSTSDRWYTATGRLLSSRANAMLYVCQQRPSLCEGRRRGAAALTDVQLVGMLWRAG